MGITTNCAKFLFYGLRQGVSFTETIMLGRQDMYASRKDILNFSEKNGLTKAAERINWNQKYAEPLFELLGATTIDSIDFSDYEEASVIHDLNFPLPDRLKNKYTVVFDGGTLEHVFNFPEALKSCMEMIKPGGHFISVTPANNQCGHGFYQLSPELFFSVFSKERGFQVKTLLLAVDMPGHSIRDWYEVSDPKQVKSRVTLSNRFPTYIMVLAQKTENVVYDKLVAYQSDYSAVWTAHEAINVEISNIKKIYKAVIPLFVRDAINRWRNGSVKEMDISGLGKVNPLFFKKIEDDNASG